MKLFLDDFSMFSDLDTHLPKLQLCFDKCRKFGISLNLEKCMFIVHSYIILGYVVSKEGKLSNLKKISISVHMPTLKTPKDIQVFNDMAQYYKCFIKDFAFMMVPITKLLQETKAFKWMTEYQQAWEEIKQRCMDALILIPPHWDMEFYVQTDISNFAVEGYVGAKPCRKM